MGNVYRFLFFIFYLRNAQITIAKQCWQRGLRRCPTDYKKSADIRDRRSFVEAKTRTEERNTDKIKQMRQRKTKRKNMSIVFYYCEHDCADLFIFSGPAY